MTPRTFGTLQRDESRQTWILMEIEPHVAIRLKAMFARISKTRTGSFSFPNTPECCADLEWFLHRYPMRMSRDDTAALERGTALFRDTQVEAWRILREDYEPGEQRGFREGRAPYPYQAQAAELARVKRQLLVMDDVGLGKTITALATLAGSASLPAAIVVQSHLATQWVTEFIEPFTTLRAHIIKGTKPYELPPADLYIFKYSNIGGWADIAASGLFKAVVYDEIQELRCGLTTAKGRAASVFTEKAGLRLGLSATPIFNYGEEIFHVMQFVAPGALGFYGDFKREWCGQGKVVKNPDALGTWMREQHLAIRRDRAGRPVNVIPLEVSYDQKVERAEMDLVRVLAMRVVSGSFIERGKAARELDIMLRQITGIAKARHVAAYVRLLLEAGQPVLLAGWHREVYAIWREELAAFKPVLYTGSETAKQKDAAKQAFIAGDTNLMMISLRSGAGLDGLQRRCATVVFGELDWSPKVHDQVIGRLDRPGQSGEVTAIFLHADSGSDPLVVSMLGLKASQSQGIIDPLAKPAAVHTDDSRIRMLAEQFLARHKESADVAA